MMTVAEELNQKTLAYWKLSSVWNGRIKREVSTGDALEICSLILERTSIVRPLAVRTESLLDELVKGEASEPLPECQIIPLKKNEIGASA